MAVKTQLRKVVCSRRRMARQQRRYAAGPNSRTMVVVCRRTSFVVITPQIAIGDRLRNLAREDSPCYSRAILLQRLTYGASREDDPLGSAQRRGILQFLRIRAGGRHRDVAVIPAPLAALAC